MNVGLIDVDGTTFPNLVLMKPSAHYKAQGHDVELLKPIDVLAGRDLFHPWDKLIGACVFDWNFPVVEALREHGAHIAGSGTDIREVLPDNVEHIMPDYSLYDISDTAYGYLTRGCPRGCPFCIVAGKEGRKSVSHSELSEWWSGQKFIKLLDPNLLANECHEQYLQSLIESGAQVDFTQGLDARLLTDSNIELLHRIRIKRLHFAWDNPRDTVTPKQLERFMVARVNPHDTDYVKYNVYVLTNYWSTLDEDLHRVYWLRDHGYNPYVMIYDKAHAPKEIRRLQRWVNNRVIFRSTEKFEEYKA